MNEWGEVYRTADGVMWLWLKTCKFPSDSAVRTQYFHGHSRDWIPGQGTKIPQAAQCSQRNKQNCYEAFQGTFLVAQWLRLCAPNTGGPSSIPGQGTRSGILQARTLEWVAISFSNAWKWKVKGNLFSHVWLFATPWTTQPTRLLHPWDFPGKSTGVGCHSLLRWPT